MFALQLFLEGVEGRHCDAKARYLLIEILLIEKKKLKKEAIMEKLKLRAKIRNKKLALCNYASSTLA